jgi:hypothetical protein
MYCKRPHPRYDYLQPVYRRFLSLKSFFTPTLNVVPLLLLNCKTQKPLIRTYSQVVYKGRLPQRVYAPQLLHATSSALFRLTARWTCKRKTQSAKRESENTQRLVTNAYSPVERFIFAAASALSASVAQRIKLFLLFCDYFWMEAAGQKAPDSATGREMEHLRQ